MILIYVLVFFFVVLIISYYIYNKNKSTPEGCIEKDVNSVFDPNTNTCKCRNGYIQINGKCQKQSPSQPLIQCPYSDPNNLIQCNPSDINSCSNCAGSGKLFSCVSVTKDNPVKINDIDVSPGNYCMPITEGTSQKCDPKIGYQALSYKPEKNQYYWSCIMKYPQMFSYNNVTGTLLQNGCRSSGIPASNPLQCTNQQKTEGKEKPFIGVDLYPTWDSTPGCDPGDRETQCRCNSGYYSKDLSDHKKDLIIKDCMFDSCSPGKTDINNNTQCICPDGYIRCPQDLISLNDDYIYLHCNTLVSEGAYPACIPDPCLPNGKFVNGNCICNNNNNDNTCKNEDCNCYVFNQVYDPNSLINKTCKDLCENNGPCGDRGDCYKHCYPATGDIAKYVSTVYEARCKCNEKHGPLNDTDFLCQKVLLEKGQSCSTDSDCISNYCHDGECTKPGICYSNKDCKTNNCEGITITNAGVYPGMCQCNNDQDCRITEKCNYGNCNAK